MASDKVTNLTKKSARPYIGCKNSATCWLLRHMKSFLSKGSSFLTTFELCFVRLKPDHHHSSFIARHLAGGSL